MKFYKKIILLILTISVFACGRMEKVQTDDYKLQIPAINENKEEEENSLSVDFTKKDAEYTTVVIKKDKSSFISLNDCIADELAYFIKNREYKDIVTETRQINGKKVTVISGIMKENNVDYFWEFSVFETKYFYFIVRVYCNLTDSEKNKKVADRVINSFEITNPEI